MDFTVHGVSLDQFRETLCESGTCIDALKRRRSFLKKRGRVLKKRGRVLKKVCFVREMGRFFRRRGWLLKRGRVPKNPVEVLTEFDPLPPTLSVSSGSMTLAVLAARGTPH